MELECCWAVQLARFVVNQVQEPEASPLTKLLIWVDTEIPCTGVENSFYKRSGNSNA